MASSTTSLWRPDLLAAVGVGFQDDPQVADGQHFRWRLAYQLGLPFQSPSEKRGLFRLYRRRGGPNTIETLQLIGGGGGGTFPIHDEAVASPDAGLIVAGRSLTFWRRPAPDLALLFMRLRGILDTNPASLWAWREKPEDQVLRRYVEEVTTSLGPDFLPNTMVRERADACAADLGFSGIGAGTPSPRGRRFATVQAIDRAGRVVDSDWVGHEPSGGPRTVARLRAAGFASVRWTRGAGQPLVNRTQTRWVFSEDYCHSEGWEEASQHRFVVDPDFHTPSVAKDHYAPFHAPFDPVEVSKAIGEALLSNAEIKALFEPGQDVFGMASRSAAFAEASDAGGGEMQVSLLQALVTSGVDPVMARILGVYAFVPASAAADRRGADVLIEAQLPFFEPKNLEAIDGRLQALLPEQDGAFFRNAVDSLRRRRLCALALSPAIELRAPVPAPQVLAASVRAAALPAQEPGAATELFVQARLDVAAGPVVARPELTTVAYLVEREVSGGGFTNISEGLGEPDILDKIGILPAVYYPARAGPGATEALRVADDFGLPDLHPASVQYRLTGFDLFGRSSAPVDSALQAIDPPALPPAAPLNPAARIVAEAGVLVLEVDFATNGSIAPLEAEWRNLEVLVHRLPPADPAAPDPRPPGEVTWAGEITARRLVSEVVVNNLLDTALVPSCASLAWTPGLTATDVPAADCAELFPPPDPQLAAVDPLASTFADTGLRSYRLRVTVGQEDQLPASTYRWCARFVMVGSNPFTGDPLASAEACVAADWSIHPPPPSVVAPITAVVPLASYPDGHGESWYDLDLSAWGLAEGDRVNVYMTRLRRLGDAAAGLVVDGVLQDQLLFEQTARSLRKPFELATREPVVYAAASPFYRIKVPGDLREVYALAVLGANAYLQERPWREAGFSLFASPDRRPEPRLDLLRLDRRSPGTATLELAADLPEPPAAASLPKVQLFRRDLSAGAKLAFVGEGVGGPLPPAPEPHAAARFGFTVSDPAQPDWRAYEYEAQLLYPDPSTGAPVRSRAAARVLARGGWDGVSRPFDDSDAIEVASGAPSGLVATVEFDCGEFDLSLVRTLGGVVTSRFAGRLRAGRLSGLDPALHTLELVRRGGRFRHRLTVRDTQAAPAPAPAAPTAAGDGAYTFRIAFGEVAAWTLRDNVDA
jgi:hypothetical protein